jgi:hypothetical protein
LPPQILTSWVRSAITTNINRQLLDNTLAIEKLERETYASLARAGWEVGTRYRAPDDPEPDEDDDDYSDAGSR